MFNFIKLSNRSINVTRKEAHDKFGNYRWYYLWRYLCRKYLLNRQREILSRYVYFTGTRNGRSYGYQRRTLSFFSEKERERSKRVILSIEYDPQNSAVFTPELPLVAKESGQEHPFTRRYLRVAIRNNGGTVAEGCKARLRLLNPPTNTMIPSGEPKTIHWFNNQEPKERQDISVGDSEILNVILSDSRFTQYASQPSRTKIFALIVTSNTIEHWWTLGEVLDHDALGIGQFMVELEVRARTGETIKGTFRVTVTQNWQELRMDRIS